MDAQTLRRALADFIKFDPSDFVVQGSLTGFNVRLAKKGPITDPSACVADPSRPTYNLTLGGFECVLANNVFIVPCPIGGGDAPDSGWYSGCVWQWIGDSVSSSDYNMAGPDVLALARFFDPADSTIKWGIRFGLLFDNVTYGTEWIDVDAASPVGDYSGGFGVIS